MKFEPFVNQLRERVRRVHPEWTKMQRVLSDPYRTDGPRGMMMWLHGANLSLDHRLAIVVLDRRHFYDPEPQRRPFLPTIRSHSQPLKNWKDGYTNKTRKSVRWSSGNKE